MPGRRPTRLLPPVALCAALLAAAPVRAEGCPEALVREAEGIVLRGESEPERLRALCAAALSDGPALAIRARCADLLAASGDDAGAAAELSALAAEAPALLGPAEWLLLAREADLRGERRAAMSLYRRFAAASREVPRWVEERRARLLLEEEAAAVPVRTFASPPPAARQAFAAAREALAAGRRAEAAKGFALALALAPRYLEAAMMLGAVEARQGRPLQAIAAYRAALAADPEHVEAHLSLAALLWGEPDRLAKEESLLLLERALTLRPEAVRPYRDAAERWAAWGEAARALDRLDVYRARVTEAERRETDDLAARLGRRLLSPTASLPEVRASEPLSPALAAYRLAEVHAGRGGAADLAAALAAAREAVATDPAFAPAHELLAALLERGGDAGGAEAALRRAVALDPTRAAAHESLAELVSRQAGREGAAEEAWRAAERAGSREALAVLAGRAAGRGEGREARRLYRRYLEEAPEGAHADEARRIVQAWDARVRTLALTAAVAVPLAVVPPVVVLARRRRGTSLAAWLARDPGRVVAVRPLVGRLRHEALKHGGLLLQAAGSRLRSDDASARRDAAELLLARLFGVGGGRGLLAEGHRALDGLVAAARDADVVLNLRHKDPDLAPVVRALDALAGLRRSLGSIARAPEAASSARVAACAARLEAAARVLGPETSARLGRLLDEAGATRVDGSALASLLQAVAREQGLPAGDLALDGDAPRPRVRMDRPDWETLWRNLLANALSAGAAARPGIAPRLALAVEEANEPVTGEARVRLALADDVPRVLTAEMIRGRAAERGLGVVADLVRKHDGTIDVTAPPARLAGFTKAVVVELPALEEAP